MTSPVLVELCAGSAAVSLRWLHPRAKPPIAYQGGKRAYADAILLAMGLRPGGGHRAGRVVLVEAGPWGEAWAFWAAGGIPDTVERLRAWADEDPRELWTRLAKAPVPTDRAERVATWAVLAYWAHMGTPVERTADRWKPSGFAYGIAYAAERFAKYKEKNGLVGKWGFNNSYQIPELIVSIESLPDLSRVQVLPHDCIEVEPIPGARVYIDPPYQGTTGYGWELNRAAVLTTAARWRAAGAHVTVSEAEPLPLDGWHTHRLGKPHGNRRTWSKQQSEWLTMSAPPVGVLNFGDIA